MTLNPLSLAFMDAQEFEGRPLQAAGFGFGCGEMSLVGRENVEVGLAFGPARCFLHSATPFRDRKRIGPPVLGRVGRPYSN